MKGRYTITAINSFGMFYTMQTTIHSFEKGEKEVKIIHKPKGQKTHYKHVYVKDQALKIYKGWIEIEQPKESISFDTSSAPIINKEPYFTF
jgi:hypothetical protein